MMKREVAAILMALFGIGSNTILSAERSNSQTNKSHLFMDIYPSYDFPQKNNLTIRNRSYQPALNTTFKDQELSGAPGGGFSLGYWNDAHAISLGLSTNMDFVVTNSYGEIVVKNQRIVLDDGREFTANVTLNDSGIFQFQYGICNLLLGLTKGRWRGYVGGGPLLDVAKYTIKAGGYYPDLNKTRYDDHTNSRTRLGYQTLAGIDYTITSKWSIKLEGKYYAVEDFRFSPKSMLDIEKKGTYLIETTLDPLLDIYIDKLSGFRLGLAVSYHFNFPNNDNEWDF